MRFVRLLGCTLLAAVCLSPLGAHTLPQNSDAIDSAIQEAEEALNALAALADAYQEVCDLSAECQNRIDQLSPRFREGPAPDEPGEAPTFPGVLQQFRTIVERIRRRSEEAEGEVEQAEERRQEAETARRQEENRREDEERLLERETTRLNELREGFTTEDQDYVVVVVLEILVSPSFLGFGAFVMDYPPQLPAVRFLAAGPSGGTGCDGGSSRARPRVRKGFRVAPLPVALETGGDVATVLVVEDDQNVREVARRILVDAGHQVATLETGHGVVDHVKEHGTEAVLLDLMLPGVRGLDILPILLELPSPPGVVVMTGWEGDGTGSRIEKALALGAKASLTKPFPPEDLLDAIQVALQARDG